MRLHEVKLSRPVKEYFEALGFTVYFEIPELQRVVDIIALKDTQIIAIELKMGYCKKVLRQSRLNCLFADRSYIAIKSKPRSENILNCRKNNIGILLVRGTLIEVLSEAVENHPSAHWRESVIESCRRNEGNNIAGLPCQKGIGHAIDVNKTVGEYLKVNPDATWKQIFANVPNHYASPASMRQSLERHRHFEYLLEKYKDRKCGECCRQKNKGCPKGRNRKAGSKVCINFFEANR